MDDILKKTFKICSFEWELFYIDLKFLYEGLWTFSSV